MEGAAVGSVLDSIPKVRSQETDDVGDESLSCEPSEVEICVAIS